MFEECCHSQVCRKNAVLHDNELSFFSFVVTMTLHSDCRKYMIYFHISAQCANFTPSYPKTTSTPPCPCAQTQSARAPPCARAPPPSLRPSPTATLRQPHAPPADRSSLSQRASSPKRERRLLTAPRARTTQQRQPPRRHDRPPASPLPPSQPP